MVEIAVGTAIAVAVYCWRKKLSGEADESTQKKVGKYASLSEARIKTVRSVKDTEYEIFDEEDADGKFFIVETPTHIFSSSNETKK